MTISNLDRTCLWQELPLWQPYRLQTAATYVRFLSAHWNTVALTVLVDEKYRTRATQITGFPHHQRTQPKQKKPRALV